MAKFPRIQDVRPDEGRTLVVTFTDGAAVHIDLAPLIQPGTVFEVLQDNDLFRAVEVGPRGRSFGWTGGLDFDADALLMDPETSGARHVVLSRTPPAPPSAVSAEVERVIRESGLTQAELARRMGTTQSALSRLTDPHYHGHSVAALERLAEATGTRLAVRFDPSPAAQRAS